TSTWSLGQWRILIPPPLPRIGTAMLGFGRRASRSRKWPGSTDFDADPPPAGSACRGRARPPPAQGRQRSIVAVGWRKPYTHAGIIGRLTHRGRDPTTLAQSGDVS